MRILLAFIIVLNLLYAAWEVLSPVKPVGVVSSLPASLKRLELLNEDKIELLKTERNQKIPTDEGVEQAVIAEDLSDEQQLPADSAPQTCYTLGPFKDEQIMQQLRESIAEYVTDLSVRKRQQSVKHRYWVFVPALSNKKRAKLVAKKLREKQVNDFYIVLSGDKKNSISLGHFREPSHANRRMKKVANLGFDTEIKVIYREYDIYWLDYRVDALGQGTNFSVDEYVSDGVSQLARDCAL